MSGKRDSILETISETANVSKLRQRLLYTTLWVVAVVVVLVVVVYRIALPSVLSGPTLGKP